MKNFVVTTYKCHIWWYDVNIGQNPLGSNNQGFKTRLQDLWMSESLCYNRMLEGKRFEGLCKKMKPHKPFAATSMGVLQWGWKEETSLR